MYTRKNGVQTFRVSVKKLSYVMNAGTLNK